jgi:acetyltransferase-like isoleucine patch superfamily enzyme
MSAVVGDAAPTVQTRRLQGSLLARYLRRMNSPSLLHYLREALVIGLCGRRRGLLGLVLRRVLYRFVLAEAPAPVLCEDVVLRGTRKIALGRGAQLEQGVVLDAKTEEPVGIRLGANTLVRAGSLLETGWTGSIVVGDRSQIGAHCEIRGLGGVVLGEDVMVAHGVAIVSGEHRYSDPEVAMVYQGNELGPVVIEDDVWLGANVVVLMNVRVGAHAIVGAGAVVREDVPAGAIAAGVPARIVGWRPGFEGGPG